MYVNTFILSNSALKVCILLRKVDDLSGISEIVSSCCGGGTADSSPL